VCYEGIVPCGKKVFIGGTVRDGKCQGGREKVVPCQFCHLFVMLNRIISFLLINIIPPVALLMIVIGGIMFYFGGGKPEFIQKGKKLIISVVIGLFLIYGAYMIVGVFLSILNVAEWTGLDAWRESGSFSINCPIELPK